MRPLNGCENCNSYGYGELKIVAPGGERQGGGPFIPYSHFPCNEKGHKEHESEIDRIGNGHPDDIQREFDDLFAFRRT